MTLTPSRGGLFYLENAFQDASLTRSGVRWVISKQMLYVEKAPLSGCRWRRGDQGWPLSIYPGCRPLAEGVPTVEAILERLEFAWITRELEQ